MKIKRILGFIFALSLAVSAVSCGNYSDEPLSTGNKLSEDTVEKTSERNKPAGYNEITVFYDEVKVCDEDLTNSYPMAANADKIFYEKYDYEEDYSEMLSGFIVDLKDSSVSADDHEEIKSRDIIYRNDKKIVYTGFYDEEIHDQERVISLDLSDGSKKTADFVNIWNAVSDHAGNIYVIDDGNILKCFDQSFDLIKEVDLTDQISQIKDNGYYLTDMCVSDDGKIFVAFENRYAYYNVFTIDETDNLIRLTDDIPTDYLLDNIFSDSSGNIVLTGSDNVSVVDSKNGNTVCSYKLYGVSDFIGPSEKYDMVYMCSDGMYGYCYEDESTELIISEDVLPDLGANFSSAYISSDKVHLSLNEKSMPVLYEIDRKTGETIKSECFGCTDPCIGTDGLLYYISGDQIVKGSEEEGTYQTIVNSVYRHEKDGSNTFLFKVPELRYGRLINGMIMNSSGELMISHEDKNGKACILVYDTAGTLKKTIYPENDNDYCALKLIQNENRKIYIGLDYYGDAPFQIYNYNEKNYSIGAKAGEIEFGYEYEYQNGIGDYDIILTDHIGIYGWKEETGTRTTIARFCDFNSEHFEMYNSMVISENEILCQDGFKLVKADEDRLAVLNSREVVTIAVTDDPAMINSFVSDFNKKSNEAYILVKDYSKKTGETDQDKSDSGFLADDIENDDIPDIVMMDDLDLSSYIVNGMFADMKEIADADPQFDLNDIYGYITDTFTYNNCLYTIPAGIRQSVMFSDEPFDNWDYNEFITADPGDKDKFHYSFLVYHHLYNDIFTPYYNDHVDIQNRKCDFDNEEFISIIKHLKDIGITIEACKAIAASNNFPGNDYKLKTSYINTACDYLQGIGIQAEGESLTPYVVGWPSENGGKRIIKPVLSFGITNKSENKETAWEFIKYVINEVNNNINDGLLYLSNGYSREFISSSSSVTEKDNREYLTEIINDTNSGFTAEDEKDYLSIFNMPVVTDFMYRKVSDIVNSELDEYFYSEDRTAEEVAEYIQNKVAQYLNEIS